VRGLTEDQLLDKINRDIAIWKSEQDFNFDNFEKTNNKKQKNQDYNKNKQDGKEFYDEIGLTLVDFKLEFGRDIDGNIILIDELSPDNFRLWDKQSGESMDKDRFRKSLGGLKVAYEEVLNRILSKN
jgi:phosphoribosylaminoimidazole-succinocarboxamide synthase